VVKSSTSAPSQLSPTLWPADAFRWYASLGVLVLVLLAMIVAPTIAAAILYLSHMASLRDLQTLTWQLMVLQFISYACILLVLVPLLPLLAQRSLAQLGLRAPRLSDLAWGIGGSIAMSIAATLTSVAQEALVHLKSDEVQVHLLRSAHGGIALAFAFLACVAAPFIEELTFRGFVFNAILRYVPVSGAVVASAVIFGAVHWQPGNAGAIFPLIASGIVLALVYYRTVSLPASMITHGLFNAFTVVAVLVFHQT